MNERPTDRIVEYRERLYKRLSMLRRMALEGAVYECYGTSQRVGLSASDGSERIQVSSKSQQINDRLAIAIEFRNQLIEMRCCQARQHCIDPSPEALVVVGVPRRAKEQMQRCVAALVDGTHQRRNRWFGPMMR